MIIKLPKLLLSILFTGLFSLQAAAETMQTTTLQLNYRQAENVIPLLEPFIHPKGAITGQDFTLIIKTTARNLNDLRQLLAEIDIAQRDVMISVAIGPTAPDNKDKATEYSTNHPGQHTEVSQLRVSEGQWATINTGISIPVTNRIRNPDGTETESIAYKTVSGGYRVLPRIQYDRVTIFVQPRFNKLSKDKHPKIESRSLETTVSGKRGAWILLAGKPQSSNKDTTHSTQARSFATQNIYIKIDIIEDQP